MEENEEAKPTEKGKKKSIAGFFTIVSRRFNYISTVMLYSISSGNFFCHMVHNLPRRVRFVVVLYIVYFV